MFINNDKETTRPRLKETNIQRDQQEQRKKKAIGRRYKVIKGFRTVTIFPNKENP